MTSSGWSLVEIAAQLLKCDDREAVLGDLLESGESPSQSLFHVLDLAVRQHLLLWKNWRPWLAAFGLALPSSFLLMGVSLSVSRGYQQFVNPAIFRTTGLHLSPAFWLFISNVLLLFVWAWSGGYVVGSVSRKTLWVSSILCFAPCLFCLARFNIECLSRLCLLLFILPAVWGVSRGLRIAHIKFTAALLLAIAVTALTVPTWSSAGAWLPNWALSWPAWYLVATAWKNGKRFTSATLKESGVAQ